ncbi:MAG: 23S rRNA (pseudouridine(1915)-N(3))-methyltransferase RlmH [Clostridiales bacterium]|nr:23S rRNA (pseudouridine(1915)-N(3))-methyltransferase RlmH [Clostridiales bacterium]
MAVTLICVGKLKERFFTDAADEYLKRLRRLMPVTVIELPDEREPAAPSDALNDAVMRREGEKILQRIGAQDHVIAMCIDGKQVTSEGLAKKISSLFTEGKSNLTFIIGGSLGLHNSVIQRANERMSMSEMTFPHQLARVMLLEQLFRAAKINAGERYHK